MTARSSKIRIKTNEHPPAKNRFSLYLFFLIGRSRRQDQLKHSRDRWKKYIYIIRENFPLRRFSVLGKNSESEKRPIVFNRRRSIFLRQVDLNHRKHALYHRRRDIKHRRRNINHRRHDLNHGRHHLFVGQRSTSLGRRHLFVGRSHLFLGRGHLFLGRRLLFLGRKAKKNQSEIKLDEINS